MRPRRGIDLTRMPDPPIVVYKPKQIELLESVAVGRLADISSWTLIGGRCSRCEREGWIDREWLEAKFPSMVVSTRSTQLRGRKCGNKESNRWVVGRRPR